MPYHLFLPPCHLNTMQSVLDVTVSCFANFKTPDNPKPVNLLHWLKSVKYAGEVASIRATADKKERDRVKAMLPAITPSGDFSRRENAALICHSGIMCLDIDPKGNEAINNYADLKQELSKVRNVAYCGLSVSATGLFVLIPIEHPDRHESQFNALRHLFQNHFGVIVDATGDVSRLRGYSFDPDAYFNHNARPFGGIYEPPPPASFRGRNRKVSTTPGNSEIVLLHRCIKLIESANEGERHSQLLKAATLAGGFIAGGGLSECLAVEALETIASEWPTFAKSQKTIRDGIRYGLVKPIYPDEPFTNHYHPHTITAQPLIVKSVAELLAKPGSILRPDESKIERLIVELNDSYPKEWDE